MEINKGSFGGQVQKHKKSRKERPPVSPGEPRKRDHSIDSDTGLKTRKAILAAQAVIGGLEFFKKRSRAVPHEKMSILNEVIENTLFGGDQLLKKYEQDLNYASVSGDFSKLDRIVEDKAGELQNLFGELGKSKVIEQNLLAVGNSLNLKNPEDLLASVISGMKEGASPSYNVTGSRVLDLLK